MLAPSSVTAEKDRPVNESICILLVDSRRSAFRKMTRYFEGTRYAWVTAADYRTAIEKLSRRRFDLILLGPELEHEERLNLTVMNNALHPAPAILVSVFPGQEHLAVDALQRGASDYVIQDTDEHFYTLLPTVVANILRRRQLEQERMAMLNTLKQRNQVLTSLNRIGGELTSILDPERLINRLMRVAIEIVSAEGGSLWLWQNDQREVLVCRAVLHRTVAPPLLGVERRSNEGVVGWVATHNQCAILDQVDQDDRFLPDVDLQINFQTHTLLAVPLRVRNQVIGVLEFVNKRSGRFNENDLVVAETLAATATTALENARLVDQLRLHTNDLEERNEELNAFGYTLAHDLQNILARIAGFADILETELGGDADSLDRRQLIRLSHLISRNSHKMSGIIDALLLFSSIRSAQVHFEPVLMELIIREVIERLGDKIHTSRAVVSVQEHWPVGLGYAPWIEEVWYNYLSNALKHGGNSPQIELGAEKNDANRVITYWVNDRGPGVNSEFAPNLFQPFKQDTNGSNEGYGLGLSIVARIVGRMGGTIGYRPLPSGGSSFFFTLPAA